MAKKGTKLHIILEVADEGGGHQEFNQKSVIIGSGQTAHLRVDDESVSSMHAIIQQGKDVDTALIVDLGSEEGILINGEEVEREGVIKRGDTISVGSIDIFVVGVGPDAIATKAEKAPRKPEEAEIEPDDDDMKEEFEGEPTRPDSKMSREESPKGKKPPKPSPARKEVKKARPPKPAPQKIDAEKISLPKRKEKTESGTQIIRKREIPRQKEIKGVVSGQNFFARPSEENDRPQKGDRFLEVKLMWGPIALDAQVFSDEDTVTVGDTKNASFKIGLDRFPGDLYTLVSPGGPEGHVVHVASGMELDVRRNGEEIDVDELPSQGAVRTYSLKIDDRVRVRIGQVAFVIQYTPGVMGVQSKTTYTRDFQMGKWWWTIFVCAIGLWFMMRVTPEPEKEGLDYLKNPARFAQLIAPTQQQKKKTFEEIKKKKEEKPKPDDDGKWKKVQAKSKVKKDANVPREVKREQDRKVATNAGILGLLKKKGGGTGDNASSVFGGSAMTSLDQSLESLNRSGMNDSGGFGGLGTRNGGPGGAGSGLGLGGIGTAGYGRGGGVGTGSVKIGHRGKARVRIRKGRTRIIGGLSQEVVGRYIKRYWAQFKFCYERELSKNPNLYGKITSTFTIAGNGRVTEANVLQSSMKNATVEQCILRVIRRIRFPTPKGGGEVIVTYPFMFTTAG